MRNLMVGLLFVSGFGWAQNVSQLADDTAKYAVKTYQHQMVEALAQMVRFKTVAVKDLPMEQNPEFINYKKYVKSLSSSLGLNYQDHGYVMIITLGQSKERFGVMTHGDVQPADATKWRKSPFELDSESEPGLLIARGTEDDKGAIASALYAMKAIKDKDIKLKKTIELIIYLAEESDWKPFEKFLEIYDPPLMNVTIDAEYPVVTAENGWSMIQVDVPTVNKQYFGAYISEFGGGAFGSQIPEDAKAVIERADDALLGKIKGRALMHPQLKFGFDLKESVLTVTARGKSAHSSTPEDGINAIAFLADVLSVYTWPKTTASLSVAYINELVGTGLYAEKFGEIAYTDAFMGDMTLAPTTVKSTDKGTNIFVNLRRPVGKTGEVLKTQSQAALDQWQKQHEVELQNVQLYFGEPLVVVDAPHVKPLLAIFSHFTGIKNPKPISIGGSTNAKLLPSAVSFGPSMPGTEYTGHSEH
ncbi:MAG: dipeptidase, partial [Algicola sp.]|nr:dipeptidase [Algicola sp.]